MLAPAVCMSRRGLQQQWEFYPYLAATLASANEADGDAAHMGYDNNDVCEMVKEFAGLAAEMGAFHEATGLVHRENKPSNIGIVHRRGVWSLILFDFDEVSAGVSTPDETQREFTSVVNPGGAWTPPEIAFLNRDQSARVPFRSDVWGLAAVL